MKSARSTTAKTEILELIVSSLVALSQSENQKLLEGLCERVAIYRVLERLLVHGVIHKIVNVDGVVNYASCHSCSAKHNHNHIHVSCKKFKSVTCFEDVGPSYKLPKNYKVSEMNFTLSGLCPQCS